MPISSDTIIGTLPVAHSYDSSKNEIYLLEQAPVAEEADRLNVQYQLLKTAFGYNDILDLPLDLSKTYEPINILDMATGTGAWILDVARIPEVQSHISALGVVNPVNLYACDISTAKLSKEFVANQLGVNFFLQDVTRPFPDHMKGKFDVVHTALLSWALTEEGWKAAFSNVHELLKPGGYFIVMDYDLGVEVPAEQIPCQVSGDASDLGMSSYFTGNPSSLSDNINAVYVDMAHHAGFLLRLSRRFPDLLKSASLTPVSSKEVDFCYGPLVKGKIGLNGVPMEPYMESALDIFVMAFDEVTKLTLVQGKLEIPKDHRVVTEEGRKRAVTEIAAGIKEKGCFEHLSEWVAQKQY